MLNIGSMQSSCTLPPVTVSRISYEPKRKRRRTPQVLIGITRFTTRLSIQRELYRKLEILYFISKNQRNTVECSAYTFTANTLCLDQLYCYTDVLSNSCCTLVDQHCQRSLYNFFFENLLTKLLNNEHSGLYRQAAQQLKITTRPQKKPLVGGILNIFTTRPQDSPQEVSIQVEKLFLYIILYYSSPQDHEKILWWGVGIKIFSFSPQDHKIHHKSFQFRKKNYSYIYFRNRFHQKTTRKSCGGGGVWNILLFVTSPQDSPQEFSIQEEK